MLLCCHHTCCHTQHFPVNNLSILAQYRNNSEQCDGCFLTCDKNAQNFNTFIFTHYMYSQFYGSRPDHTSHLALHSIPPPQQLPMTSVTTSSPVSVRPAMVTEAAWTECRSHGQEGGAQEARHGLLQRPGAGRQGGRQDRAHQHLRQRSFQKGWNLEQAAKIIVT